MNMHEKLDLSSETPVSAERLQQIIDVAEKIVHGEFENRIMNIPVEDGLERNLCVKISEMIDRADAYVRESTACLGFIADNQYFRRIAPEGLSGAYGFAADKINGAADGIEQKTQKFTEAVQSISSASVQLNSSAELMGQTVSQASEKTSAVAAAAEEAGSNTQTVASAAEELNSSIQEINRQVTHSAEMSANAVDQSKEVNEW